MIENQILKILDANPLFIKSLGAYLSPNPLLYLILYKYWGRIDVDHKKKKKVILDYNWHEFHPKQPLQELLEIMRSQ